MATMRRGRLRRGPVGSSELAHVRRSAGERPATQAKKPPALATLLLLGAFGALLPASCQLSTEGTGGASPPSGGGSGGGDGSSGGGGTEIGGGPGAGTGGASTAGSGGEAGAPAGGGAGAGGAAGGSVVPIVPNVLGCTIWLPSDPSWGLGGDARRESTRIVLTPPDASPRLRWGQAFLPLLLDPQDEIEVAFTFTLEPGGAGDDYARGVAFWFATPSNPFPPIGQAFDTTLGVPGADAGIALALDTGGAQPSWGLYLNPFNDGRTLGGVIQDKINDGSSNVSAAVLAATHTTRVRMARVLKVGTDDVGVVATFVAPEDASTLTATFNDGENVVLGGGQLGFSAGSTEGAGATHALLGIEIKIDDVCRNP
jgi:hypothetical protein